MKYPLTLKALELMEASYEDYGSIPEQARILVSGAIKAIGEFVDRPEEEKDALMAATALYFSTDMTIYKTPPLNVEEYGPQVQQILEDMLANPSKPFGASRDLMQIGLALSLPAKDIALDTLKQTREKLEEIAEDPKLLKLAIKKMQEAIVKGQKDGALHFTGEQPRLEAKAKEVMEAIKTATEDLVNYMVGLLSPPPANTNRSPVQPTP